MAIMKRGHLGSLSAARNTLRPFLDSRGVHGHFDIQFNQDNELVRLDKISAWLLK
jgi:hypothetical protein